MNISLLIIVVSLLLQMISVFMAFRLIVRQGKRTAGVIIILTLVLMAFRRTLSFYRLIEGSVIRIDVPAELVALAVSAMLLLGIIFIGRLISSLRNLRGLLPICYSCRRVRDEAGQWKQIEIYIEEHSKAEFSHGLCPECGVRYQEEIIRYKNGHEKVQE